MYLIISVEESGCAHVSVMFVLTMKYVAISFIRIEATRDLCAVVKDYSVRLEEKLTVCEQDRDDIQESQKKCQEDFVVGTVWSEHSIKRS